MARERGGFWIWFASAFFHPLCRLLARRDDRNTERVPKQGAALLVMNHISHIDPVYDAVFVHRLHRLPHFLAKESLFRPPLVRLVMHGTGQIPVYRGTTDAKDSLRDANVALAEDKIVIIYPEGTITKQPDGWPMYARTGVARLALSNDVPVLPVARWGTRAILDGYHRRFRPFPRHDVITVVGEPVDLSAYRDKIRDREPTLPELREVTDLLMGEVTRMVADIRGETAPAEVFRPAAKAEGAGS
ncbi:MAG TPA: lysophospholipid acyltransferase family protein [Pseudonocardiaceae bacterium]|nr:lysophospholipid acyltransferase family protein [Pseudonocardiaceae bacterium]